MAKRKHSTRAAEIAARLPKAKPAAHALAEAWGPVTTILYVRQIVALDRLCADVRAKTGRAGEP